MAATVNTVVVVLLLVLGPRTAKAFLTRRDLGTPLSTVMPVVTEVEPTW